MRHIRRLVYKLGFRPKPRSIFYSPWMDGYLAGKEAMWAFQKGFYGYKDPPANGVYYSRADDIRE